MENPFLTGSIFEEGTVSMMWEGDEMDGTNSMQLLVMWMLASKILLAWVVNSPHLRNPQNVVMAVALKLSLLHRFGWVVGSRMCARMSWVIGILGICSCSPMYLLMPLMTHWSKGDSHAENGNPALTWADRRSVTYDLFVLC